MKLNLYSIFDKKAGIYQTPVFLASDVFAIRSVRSAIKDAGSVLAQYPDDFSLVKLGEFDPSLGFLLAFDDPCVVIGTFAGLIDEKPAPEA